MKPFNRITFEERQIIEKLLKENMSVFKIADAIGKSFQTLYKEFDRAGGKKFYNADAAQERADQCRLNQNIGKIRVLSKQEQELIISQRKKGISLRKIAYLNGMSEKVVKKFLYSNNPQLTLPRNHGGNTQNIGTILDRLTNLEQQVEIILDIIKELK